MEFKAVILVLNLGICLRLGHVLDLVLGRGTYL